MMLASFRQNFMKKKYYKIESSNSRRVDDSYDHCDFEGFSETDAKKAFITSQVDAKRELESDYYKGDDSIDVIFSVYEIPDDIDLELIDSFEDYLIKQQSCNVVKYDSKHGYDIVLEDGSVYEKSSN